MEIEYKSITLEIEYDFYEGEPMVWRYNDGSGHPGSPDEVEINKIIYTDSDGDSADVTEIFNELGLIQDIEAKVLEQHEN